MSKRHPSSEFLFRTALWNVVVCGLIASMLDVGAAPAAPRLVTRDQARRLGLERAWFAQVRLDRSRNQVERAVLHGDRLTVLTSAGVVHEFNALTGETLWIAAIGNPNYPSLGPAASDGHIALLNGSTLYVLDRADGRPVVLQQVGGAPGAAPALSKEHVFVPLLSGRIEGYPLGEQTLTPWYYQSQGRASVPPLATPRSIVWATEIGHVYVGGAEDLGVRFRLETGSEIMAPPAYRSPYVYIATMSGELFAMHELTGARRAKYATGFPLARAPAAVGERVFVTSDEPTLHCVDAVTATGLWEAPNVTQFAAASRKRVYGVDELGALVVLDAASGTLVDRMPTQGQIDALVNDQTDRLYLISNDGMVQCLHEIGAQQPLYHQPPETEEGPAEPGTESEMETTEPLDEDEEIAPRAEADDDPFGGMDDTEVEAAGEPADSEDAGFDDDDPFGGF